MATAHAHTETRSALAADHLEALRTQIRRSKLFTVNNLNRDFVGTRGFSVAFTRPQLGRVRAEFPISLKAFGVTNQYVGSPAVAEAWDVSVDILGVVGK